jgi:hypothetical protein
MAADSLIKKKQVFHSMAISTTKLQGQNSENYLLKTAT